MSRKRESDEIQHSDAPVLQGSSEMPLTVDEEQMKDLGAGQETQQQKQGVTNLNAQDL